MHYDEFGKPFGVEKSLYIERLKDLSCSSSESEEFTVDLKSLGDGIKVLPANT